MLKLKTILFWVFFLLALGFGIYAYYALKKSKRPTATALSALPDSCAVYMNTSNFFDFNTKIKSKSIIADKLRQFTEVELVFTQIQEFDSLFSNQELLKEQLEDNSLHFALYTHTPGWMATFNIKQLGSQLVIAEALGKVLNSQEVEKNIFVTEIGKPKTIYYALKDGIIILCNNIALLKKSLNPQTARLEKNKSFNEFTSTLHENSTLNLYVNHELYALKKNQEGINLSAFFKKGYTAAQIETAASELSCNGFMMPDSTELLSALANEPSQSPKEFLTILPRSLTAFNAYGFGSFVNLKTRLFKVSTKKNANRSFWQQVADSAMYNLEKEFEANIGNHLLSFETSLTQEALIALHVKDTSLALEQLGLMSDTLDSANDIKTFKLKQQKGGLCLFTPLFENQTLFCAVVDSYLLFASEKKALKDVITELKQDLRASINESFNHYASENFPDDYNFLFYTNPFLHPKNTASFLRLKSLKSASLLANFKHFSLSLSNGVNSFKFRLHLLHEADNNIQEKNTLWTLNLDTVCTTKAHAFVNHNTGENELIVQDDATNLYLINAKGAILWKRRIGEKIMSTIYQVDVFKNNKFQLLFNTRNHIYLIDRNGKDVKGYPIDLPAEATSPLFLADYDGDKDYRIFIACADKSIYNYNAHGLAQEGFVPVKTEHQVCLPLQYVTVAKSDYLVSLDKEGKIYTFSRKGAGRIGLKNRAVANCQAFYVDVTNNLATTNLICVDDKSALINKISFVDKRELVKLGIEPGNANINFCLVDNNRDMDIVIASNSHVCVSNCNGDLLFDKSFDGSNLQPGYYSDESHALYYTFNVEKSELVLWDELNQKGKKLKATAPPHISNLFNDSKKYLLISYQSQLLCLPVN